MKVYYNGITLFRVMTTGWDESVEYDSSGMNMIANKITLSFEGSVLLNGRTVSIPSSIDPEQELVSTEYDPCDTIGIDVQGVPGLTFRQRLNMALRNLSMSGGTLVVYDDVLEQEILSAYSSLTENLTDVQKRNIDVAGGPKPRSVRVTQIVNEYARIAFTVEVSKIRCLAGETSDIQELGEDPLAGFVVSNRCWTEESLDSNFYTTRTFSGRLRISSPNISVQYYRDLYYPPLEDGFRRESVRFSESENGLELSYSVTDKQVRCSAPYPATAFSGTVSYGVINGSDMRMNMQLTMIGRPDCPKDALTARALQAVTRKIEDFTRGGTTGYQEKFNVSENLGDPPSVTVDVAYRLYTKTKSAIGTPSAVEELAEMYMGNIQQIGKPLEFDDFSDGEYVYSYVRTKSPNPNPYGYEVYSVADNLDAETDDEEPSPDRKSGRDDNALGFIKCLASVPCAVLAPVEQAMQEAGGDELEALAVTKVVQNKDGVTYSEEENGAVEESIDYPYSFFKSDITYSADYSRFALPKARPVPEQEITGTLSGTLTSGTFGATINNDGEAIGTVSATGEGQQFTGTASITSTGKTGTVSFAFASTPTDGAIEGEIEGTTISGTVTPTGSQTGIAFTGTVTWNTPPAPDPGDNTRVVTLARTVPKATVVIEAERYNRLPELPDPDEVVTTTGDDPIKFVCTNVETTLCEPKPARNNDGVSYSLLARYSYVMSREYKKGDEVWLLSNPTFESSCYYPKKRVDGEKVDVKEALTVLYDGAELNHSNFPAPEPEPEPEQNDAQS